MSFDDVREMCSRQREEQVQSPKEAARLVRCRNAEEAGVAGAEELIGTRQDGTTFSPSPWLQSLLFSSTFDVV